MTSRTVFSRPAACIALTLALFAAPAMPRAGGEAALEKYRDLLEEKSALRRENWFLQKEASLAASHSPYILFDVQSRKLEFRVRGKAFKSYRFSAVSYKNWGRRPVTAELIWRELDEPLTILEKEGGRPEIIPPSRDGDDSLYQNTNQADPNDGESGDAAMLGVEAPTDYYIKFEEKVVFHIRSEKSRSLHDKAIDRLSEIAGSVRSRFYDLWLDPGRDDRPRMTLYLTTDVDTAKQLYHSLLPGERIYITPPPPPPVALVASRDRP